MIFHADCREHIKGVADNTYSSIVSDPPYELTSKGKGGFMGKKWDATGIIYDVEFWRECLRIVKPGGFLMVFGSPRTYHRMAVAIEDSGWILRTTIMWLYLSNFPKAQSISNKINKKANIKGRVIGKAQGVGTKSSVFENSGMVGERDIHAYATNLAQKYKGYRTPELKTMFEPIIMAEKAVDGSYANNAKVWGQAGINVDATRIGFEPHTVNTFDDGAKPFGNAKGEDYTSKEVVGRYPGNVIISEDVAEEIGDKWGETKDSGQGGRGKHGGMHEGGWKPQGDINIPVGEGGSLARMFYQPKATQWERELFTDGLPLRTLHRLRPDKNELTGLNKDKRFAPVKRRNNHVTVKPLAIMVYLIKLVACPDNCKIFDPFGGSGTTEIACMSEGILCDSVEQDATYFEIAKHRIEIAKRLFNSGYTLREIRKKSKDMSCLEMIKARGLFDA